MEQFVNTVSVQQPAPSQEDIRKKYLNHEACVKSIGLLYYLGAILTILLGVGGLIAPRHDEVPLSTIMRHTVLCILLIGIGVFQFCVAYGLQKLRQWTRIPTIILSSIGLIGFPIGTVVNAYILYLVVSKKGKVVLSNEYKAVIQATPHIRYKISIIVWIVLAVFLTLIAIAIIAAMISK
jgi:hypothetical protein